MHGFYNKLLIADAARRSFDIETIPDDVLARTLGGKGLATHWLLHNNPARVDPLGPENHLIFATGPATGTAIWGSCRHGVYTKSPQTGYYSESYSGGSAAEYMARTGLDAVVLRGRFDRPAWIEVHDEQAVFHDATDLWGGDTYKTEDRVREWIKEHRPEARNCAVVCIGPAGENQVRFAVIENDYWRSAGRTGVGAVMGSKNVKAVAFWGTRKKELADPEAVKRFAREFGRAAKDNKGVHAYKSMGTPMMVDIMSKVGSFPTRYWHKGQADHKEGINAGALHERMDVVPNACLRCFIACGRLGTVKQGRHKGLKIEGPEYETIYAFGGLCEVRDIEDIAFLNDLCDRLGLDTISMGNLVAFAIEAAQQGRISADIDYGHVDRIAELIRDTAYRRGLGAALAQGIKAVAKDWNMEDQAVHVKGLEPAGYDPRVLKGMGLSYGISDRGACHLRTTFYKPELAEMIDPDQIQGKAEMLAEWEDRLTVFDCLILCRFYRDLYQWEQLSEVIRALTGLTLDRDGMRAIAGHVADETRAFNIREGLTPEEDCLPKRFHTEPLPETGKRITPEQMQQLLADYYRVRGWDEQGRPPAPAS